MVNTIYYRIFDGLNGRVAVQAVCLDAVDKEGIFLQAPAACSQLTVMAIIDVQHPDCQLQAGCALCVRKGICQVQVLFIRHFVIPVVEYHTLGRGKGDERLPVNVRFHSCHQSFILRGDIEQEPQGKIGAECALMLI